MEQSERYGECAKHPGENMVNCSECELELIFKSRMTKHKQPILYCDLDGVVADFKKAVVDINPKLINSHELDDEEEDAIIAKICLDNPMIFHTLPPIEGAIEAIKKLSQWYEIHFLSTPMYEVPESYSGKRIWLEKHFGDLAKKRLTLTHHKNLSIGDYLIDDRTKHGAGEFTGHHIHLWAKSFPTWNSVVEFLEAQILEKINCN